MFEFFIALFGGAYILNKLSGEKTNHKIAQRKLDRAESIRELLYDFEVERQYREKFFYKLPIDVENGTLPFTNELYESLIENVLKTRDDVIHNIIPESDMIYVFGENWDEWFKSRPTDFDSLQEPASSWTFPHFQNIWDVVFNIWFSMNGFLTYDHTFSGYNFMMDIQGVLHKDRIKVASRACEVIERNINEKKPGIYGLKLYTSSTQGSKLVWQYESPDFIGDRLWNTDYDF